MTLLLTTADQNALARAMGVILRPLSADEEPWLKQVCGTLKALTYADTCGVAYQKRGRVRVVSTDRPEQLLAPYAELSKAMNRRFGFFRRGLELGVYLRDMVWPDLDAYYRSEYYNEFIVPNRMFDALGMLIRPAADDVAARPLELVAHHERSSGPTFGERGLLLFRLVRPAFEAALRHRAILAEHRASIASVVDSIADGLVVCDPRGRVLHQNIRLTSMLSSDPERSRLRTTMLRVASVLAQMINSRTWAASPRGSRQLCHEILTASGRYSVRGSLLGPATEGGSGHIIISLTRHTPAPPTPTELCERFGLTPRQATVAIHLAAGRANAEIATRLGISPHTARHHSEQVLARLGVRSRAEVASRILH